MIGKICKLSPILSMLLMFNDCSVVIFILLACTGLISVLITLYLMSMEYYYVDINGILLY